MGSEIHLALAASLSFARDHSKLIVNKYIERQETEGSSRAIPYAFF